MSKLLVVDFGGSSPAQFRGAEAFLASLRSSGVVVVSASQFSDAAAIRTATADGNEFVGFAGDSNCDVALAAQVAKSGGVIFAYGEGPLASFCRTSGGDAPERDACLVLNDFGEASRMRSFQQRIGGN
jgi:hypothetical protein